MVVVEVGVEVEGVVEVEVVVDINLTKEKRNDKNN